MTIQFDSFTLTQDFACPVARLFAAFTDPVTKRAWYADGGHSATHDTLHYELDARVGGKEVFRIVLNDKTPVPGLQIDMEGECVALVPDALIVVSARMIARGQVVSLSNETFEFVATDKGARLTLTQQGTYLEGSDGPVLRRRGHEQLFADLQRFVAGQA